MDAPKCKICETRHWGSACHRPSSKADLAKMVAAAEASTEKKRGPALEPKRKPKAKPAATKRPGRPSVDEAAVKARKAEQARKRRAAKKAAAQ